MTMTGMSQFPGREADYRFAALLSLEKMSEGPPAQHCLGVHQGEHGGTVMDTFFWQRVEICPYL